MKHYSGIGARDTPDEVLEKMAKIALVLRKRGFILRSGGARGADTAFERGAGNMCEIFHPGDRDVWPEWCDEMTQRFHPAPHKLKGWAKKCMDRNAMILLGENQTHPSKFVVCWTPEGKIVGGTGQALRMADHFNIPVFNLAVDGDIDILREFVSIKDYKN